MTWIIAISALVFTAFASMVGIVWRIGKGGVAVDSGGQLRSFLLADGGLQRFSVANLLLSTSFSLNGMLYQAWLGYQIGLWALLVQGAWAASYFLLSRHVPAIRSARSLHSFLGTRFGAQSQILAGICSIVGFMVLIGWEFNVGKATFEGLLNLSSETPRAAASQTLALTVSAVAVCVLYTVMGGLKSNVIANYVQNAIKLAVFCGLIVLVVGNFISAPNHNLRTELFPSWEKVLATLGIVGLATNLIFSLAWQFVDMSTWHSVAASREALDEKESTSALRWGGLLVFIAPGIIGTLLGAFLTVKSGVDGDNIMAQIVSLLPYGSDLIIFLVFSALLASIMSMIDGLLLASAYALVCDIIFRDKSLHEVDKNRQRSDLLLGAVRVFLSLIALLGTLGVYWLLNATGLSLFDIVYVLIIAQLSLFGPVFVALRWPEASSKTMHWAIIIGLTVGAVCIFVGKVSLGVAWLLECAGTFALLSSLVAALACVKGRLTFGDLR